MNKFIRRLLASVVLSLFISSVIAQPVMAAMISTGSLLGGDAVEVHDAEYDVLRQQVQQLLMDRGVSASDASLRAASLSHAELTLIQNKIDSLPAGQGALEVLGILFLVLLVLEILGVTNVFNKL